MIVFVSNFLNHHQFPVASILYEKTDGQYRFIETEPMPDWIKKGGYSEYENLPWLIRSWKSKETLTEAERLVENADVVVFCNNLFLPVIRKRLEAGRLTFDFGERWLKRGLVNLLSPRLLKAQYYYHRYFYNKPLYRLNSSAYAANDFKLMHSFKDKMYKWGYFTVVPDLDVERIIEVRKENPKLKILAVARFLVLKHPELAVQAAARLMAKGYDFEINMYGSGPEEERIKKLIKTLGVEDYVFLKGNLPNAEILKQMQSHDMFIFTSDKNEGWGAVINEAMGNACPVVGSDAVGSVPFLIEDGKNGLIFKSEDIDDFTAKIELLLQSRELREDFARKAYSTMKNIWSPLNAAESFLQLVGDLNQGLDSTVTFGPCSKAVPLK